MNESLKKPKRVRSFSAVDMFIILLLVLCLGGAALRIFDINGFSYGVKEEEYYLSYIISGVKSEVADSFTEGAVFYTENGEVLGAVTGEVISTPARVYTENSSGVYIEGYTNGSEIDIKGTFAVKGKKEDRGFLCSGNYICANMKLKIVSPGMSAEILVTDISKAS